MRKAEQETIEEIETETLPDIPENQPNSFDGFNRKYCYFSFRFYVFVKNTTKSRLSYLHLIATSSDLQTVRNRKVVI